MSDGKIDVSVIVVAWNVEAYIAQAVASCIGQSLKNIEIIVVENGSTDGTRGVIEGVVAGHPNVVMLRNDTNTGVGPARNQGIAMAHGEYIAFLDGDDWLEPQALEEAFKAAETGDADVLVFDVASHAENGRVVANYHRKYLGTGLCGSFAERLAAARTSPAVWHKLYRREFVLREKFTFSDSYYEDTDWTYPIMMVAGRVATLPQALVNYRKRTGSITRSISLRHAEAFDRWRSVLKFMEINASRIDPRWRLFISDVMARHLENLINSRSRVKPSERFAYAVTMSQLLKQADPRCELKLRFDRQLRYKAFWHGRIRFALALLMAMKWPKG